MRVGDKVVLKDGCSIGVWGGTGIIVHSYRESGMKIFLIRWDAGHCSRHIEDAIKKIY